MMVPTVLKVLKVSKVNKVQLVQLERLDRKVHKETWAQRVILELKVFQALPAKLVLLVSKVLLDRLVQRDQ